MRNCDECIFYCERIFYTTTAQYCILKNKWCFEVEKSCNDFIEQNEEKTEELKEKFFQRMEEEKIKNIAKEI